MKRAIDITVGLLLFVTAAFSAGVFYIALASSVLRSWLPLWLECSFAFVSTIAALAAIALFRWRRRSALVGVVAAFMLAGLWFPTTALVEVTDYTVSALFLAVSGLVYWRFLWTASTPPVHTEV